MEGLVVPQPLPACAKRLAPTTAALMKAITVCSGAIAWGDPYSKGITADTRFGNSKAPSHVKNDAISANGVTAFGVVCIFSSSELKAG
jgi:hypothetical protein